MANIDNKLINNKPDILIFHITRDENSAPFKVKLDNLRVDSLFREKVNVLYDLISIVCLNGDNYCREGEKWFCYNGKNKNEVQLSDLIKDNANLLLYRKKSFYSLNWGLWSKFFFYL